MTQSTLSRNLDGGMGENKWKKLCLRSDRTPVDVALMLESVKLTNEKNGKRLLRRGPF